MDFASICVDANRLGYGSFSTAFAVPGDHRTVVLLETTPGCYLRQEDPQRYAYMGWCAARLKKYGLRSPQMALLPEVYWVGMFDGKRCCVMRRYYRNGRIHGVAWNEAAAEKAAAFRKAYGRVMHGDDLHGGNMWWCPDRHQWVVTDPIAECNHPPPFDAPLDFVAVKARKVAQWKQSRIR